MTFKFLHPPARIDINLWGVAIVTYHVIMCQLITSVSLLDKNMMHVNLIYKITFTTQLQVVISVNS